MTRRDFFVLVGLLAATTTLGWMTPARADAVGLQLAPLKYEQNLTSHSVQQGYIDVSNPADSTVDITTAVQGFSQIDNDGNLAYFHDDKLSAAIIPGLSSFQLGPRAAVRVSFTVDPSKLPRGGVYAVIFFQTEPTGAQAGTSFIDESARVGTLLILRNGAAVPVKPHLQLGLSWLQLGSGLHGTVDYHLSGGTVGSTPRLITRLNYWGASHEHASGLVLPGASRRFDVSRPGAYLGPVHFAVTDSVSGVTTSTWTFACTGMYQSLLALILAVGLVIGWRWRHYRRKVRRMRALN